MAEDRSVSKHPDLTSPAVATCAETSIIRSVAENTLGDPGFKCSNASVMKSMRSILTALVFTAASTAHGGEIDDLLAKAKEGDVIAQMQVAEKYAKGQGVAQSSKEAAEWYQKAAEQGNADAQLSLGSLFIGGKGMPKNSVEAAKWYLLAAEQGRPAAQIQMARMHLAGAGVIKDDVQACKWASLAAAQGDKQANPILVVLKKRMTVEQTTQAELLVQEHLEKKAADDATQGIPRVAPPLE